MTLADGRISFEWRDGPVLKAIREGAWLLLDEMNLASQAVLEALNSCFDFRGQLYIAELGRTFDIQRSGSDNARRATCRFFAAQNPARQGGSRKALPKSFLNRFTKIHIQPMSDADMRAVVAHRLAVDADDERVETFLQLHARSNELISQREGYQYAGAPYEYNLRDLLRLIECVGRVSAGALTRCRVATAAKMLASRFQLPLEVAFELFYLARLGKASERRALLTEVLDVHSAHVYTPPLIRLAAGGTQLDFSGQFQVARREASSSPDCDQPICAPNVRLLACQSNAIRRLAACVACNQLALLVSPAHTGKRSIVEALARLLNAPLRCVHVTAETDAQDLLGSYEQVQMSASSALRFEWVDSEFVRAYTSGDWLLVEDVSACR